MIMLGRSLAATTAGILALCAGTSSARADDLVPLKGGAAAATTTLLFDGRADTQLVARYYRGGGYGRGYYGGYSRGYYGGYSRGYYGGYGRGYYGYSHHHYYRPYYLDSATFHTG